MPWADVAPAIVTELTNLGTLGTVYQGLRHMRDATRAKQLLVDPETVISEGRWRTQGWFLGREAIAEDWYTQSTTLSQQTYVLRGYGSVRKRTNADISTATSERDWQILVDGVRDEIRTWKTLASAELINGAQIRTIDFARFPSPSGGQALYHYAEIEIPVQEVHTITPGSEEAITATGLAARDGYDDVSAQLGAVLTGVDSTYRVHLERPLLHDLTDVLDLMTVAQDSDGRNEIRAWRIFRSADLEDLDLSSLLEARPSYSLTCSLGWSDSSATYDEFQTYLDTVRSTFRGLPRLGRPSKVTGVLSTPLQVGEIGARDLMGYLVHFADCGIGIEETVYA